MSNEKDISNCFDISIHNGIDGIYHILKIKKEYETLDANAASKLKNEFEDYFKKKSYDANITKHALDMSNVKEINSSGVAAILIFNALSINNEYGKATIFCCRDQVENIIKDAGIDEVVRYKKNKAEI